MGARLNGFSLTGRAAGFGRVGRVADPGPATRNPVRDPERTGSPGPAGHLPNAWPRH